MFRIVDVLRKSALGCGLVLTMLVPCESAQAQSYSLLYSFEGGSDGANPQAGLIANAAGDLYGTTGFGGASGSGTVFEVSPKGVETQLYSFCAQQNCADGLYPYAGLIADANGNLYGTTYLGGSSTGSGVVFEVSPKGAETVLYAFCAQQTCADGRHPRAGLLADANGNLYGTTIDGGGGLGTVFKLSPKGTEKVLRFFTGSDGARPLAGLIADAKGNLYGTAYDGGGHGDGSVFKISRKGAETVLYSFCAQQPRCTDGLYPYSALIADKSGNLYGTTDLGGATGNGTVFKVSPKGAEKVLYSFCAQQNCTDGKNPQAGLIADANGNLYGTTVNGGANGSGTVFELSTNGTETVLYSFCAEVDCFDGANPYAGLIADAKGDLYGTTYDGGANNLGTVFRLAK